MLIQSYKYATFDAKLIIFYSPIPRKSPMADPDIRLGVQACDGQRDWAKGDLICLPVSHAYFFVWGIEVYSQTESGDHGRIWLPWIRHCQLPYALRTCTQSRLNQMHLPLIAYTTMAFYGWALNTTTRVLTYTDACMHTCIHAHTYTLIHKCTHTYINTHEQVTSQTKFWQAVFCPLTRPNHCL